MKRRDKKEGGCGMLNRNYLDELNHRIKEIT